MLNEKGQQPVIFLLSPYWREPHRWMVSSVKLAELWQRLGYQVHVLCMGSESGTEQVSDTLTIHRRKDFFLKDPLNFGISLGFAGHARRLIAELKPDIVICNKVLFWSSFGLPLLRLSGIRITLLTDALVGMTWWPRGLLPKIIMGLGAWTWGWLVLLSAERIVTFHPQPKGLLRLLGITGKTQVIPTGIDMAPYERTEDRGQRTEVTVTYVGRLESVKGVDDFLEAVTPLKREFPTLRINVAGWYTDPHPLVEKYRNDVAFLGLRDDVPQILKHSNIFVLPSYSEGLSNALMEAMASGCACIATNVGGNTFLLAEGAGLLFTPGDRSTLQSHVRTLLSDSAQRTSLGAAARKRIETHFSWQNISEQYRELFASILQR